MKIVNRGFIVITPKKAFADWANEFDLDFEMEVDEHIESSIYLIEEDFMENDLLIEQNFKKILKSELSMITENEADWPEKLSIELFNEWFSWKVGTTVFDLEKNDLKAYKD